MSETRISLIGDDDVPPFIPRTIAARKRQDGENFEELQNLGHKTNSEDFTDSPFADRA